MARREKVDLGLASRLDEFERRIFLLKIAYEKYFSGLERIEPLRERDDMRRELRDMMQLHVTNSTQRYRLSQLRARFSAFELYWTRNLVMIERGTHPKMKFRAARHEAAQRDAEVRAKARQEQARRRDTAAREETAYQAVYDKYMEARGSCGQSTDMSFDAVRDALKKQVRTIKAQYRCNSVKFRVTVEDGKAKVKAVPVR